MRSVINYEVFVRMMNRWTDEDQARLAQAKARHLLPSCPFVDSIQERAYPIDQVDPHLRNVAAALRRDLHWTDVGRYATKGPRGLAVQRLRVSGDVNGARCGSAYVVVDEVSGECGS